MKKQRKQRVKILGITLKLGVWQDIYYCLFIMFILASIGIKIQHSKPVSPIPQSYADQLMQGNHSIAASTITPSPTPTLSPTPTPQIIYMYIHTKEDVQTAVKEATINDFGARYWPSAEKLVMQESGFNPEAVNRSSGACGLFQALPCQKLPCTLDNVSCQIEWGMGYIKNRYGNPDNAWSFHLDNNWY